ncbi:TPA: hypothetical protein ACU1PB_002506 [Staphylococcus aureus]|uniref:hypothetical protein n=1 Tax=Staphylococcus aureus TaxID=1280 RepID=UPI003528E7B5
MDRLIQQEEQHNQIHNQLDKVIKLIRITLHKHNLEIKQHRQTKQVKEITKQHLIIMQHRQIKHSQRMLQQQRNQQQTHKLKIQMLAILVKAVLIRH